MKKIMFTMAVMLVAAFSFIVCDKGGGASLKVQGSDTMVQLSQQLAKAYMAKYPEKIVSIQGGGSGTGIAALLNQSADIANASRKMKEKEWNLASKKEIKVTEHIVGLDALAVIVHGDNKLTKLTIDQLSDIYAGKITNWKELGGVDAEILVISRDSNSGTHVFFKEEVLRKGDKKSELEFGQGTVYAVSNQAMIDQVKTNPSAIAYVGMGWLIDEVKLVAVSKNGKIFVLPSFVDAQNGSYPLARTLQIYVNEASAEKASSFVEFIMSPEGQAVVKEVGFVPVK